MQAIKRFLWPISGGHFSLMFVLGLIAASHAQTGPTNTLMPVVTIAATDPSASWAGDTGTFTLFRTGDPTQTLNVYCRILGTATNGVDYQAISSFVQIP